MTHIHQRKNHSHLHKVKRLHRHNESFLPHNLPPNLFDGNFLNKTSQYIKYFDYALAELISDHSTDPLQNSTRQCVDIKTNNLHDEGRFTNHEMIIRRNGETTILRPKQDFVLANGFTPVIRPSSLLPSYQSIMSHSQPESSLSIMDKMSIKKPEQGLIIKTKRNNRYKRKRCNEKFIEKNHLFQDYNVSNKMNQNNSQDSTFIHLVQQALHDIIEERKYSSSQPVPLMSIRPQFSPVPSNYHNPTPPLFEEPNFNHHSISSPFFNKQNFIFPPNQHQESFYNHPPEFRYPPHEHHCSQSPRSHQRNYRPMSGYFFD